MARALQQRGMKMGVFVASMPKWAEFRPLLGGNDDGDRQAFLTDIRASIDVAKRLNAKWMTVVTGFLDRKLPVEIQTGRIIDTMRRAAEIVEPHGLVMVMEPLNTLVNHPGVFMQTIPQGFAVAKGANSPAVKVLADLYHEQIQAGNLINTLQSCWDEIGYIQFGDNPGRKEPGSGEINYRNVVRWLRAKRFAGVIGMEHGNSIEGRAGEERLIAAYREIDAA
jgi:hydroxypyruvate isomerase